MGFQQQGTSVEVARIADWLQLMVGRWRPLLPHNSNDIPPHDEAEAQPPLQHLALKRDARVLHMNHRWRACPEYWI